MTRLIWHQWLSLGLAAFFLPAVARHGTVALLLGVSCVAAIAWGFAASNDADRARADAERAMTWARRDREAGRR